MLRQHTKTYYYFQSQSEYPRLIDVYHATIKQPPTKKRMYNFSTAEKQDIHRFPAFSSETYRNTLLSREPLHSNTLRLLNLTYDCQLFFSILWTYMWTYIWFFPHFVELLPVISGQNAKFYRQNPSHLVICSYLNLMFTVRKSSFSAIFRIPRSSRLLLLKKQSGPIPNQSV